MAKTDAAREHDEIDPNRELIGLGAGNLGAGLCSGMVVNGSLSKTAVNGTAGARSQVSGLVVAVLTIVTLLFLTGLFENLPEATLAAVVIAAVVELVDTGALRGFYNLYTRQLGRIYGKAARPDFIAAVTAMMGVLLFDTLPAVIGSLFAAAPAVPGLQAARRRSRPRRRVGGPVQRPRTPPRQQAIPGVAVLRVESGLFFANTDAVPAAIKHHAGRPASAVSCSMPKRSRSSRSPRCGCSTSSPTTCTNGQRLVLAHDLGQVGDLLAQHPDSEVEVRPTIAEAIASVRATDPRDPGAVVSACRAPAAGRDGAPDERTGHPPTSATGHDAGARRSLSPAARSARASRRPRRCGGRGGPDARRRAVAVSHRRPRRHRRPVRGVRRRHRPRRRDGDERPQGALAHRVRPSAPGDDGVELDELVVVAEQRDAEQCGRRDVVVEGDGDLVPRPEEVVVAADDVQRQPVDVGDGEPVVADECEQVVHALAGLGSGSPAPTRWPAPSSGTWPATNSCSPTRSAYR